jgi:hypothetical protein
MLAIILLLTLNACKKEDSPTEPETNNPSNSDVIKVGTLVNVTSQPVGSSGGTINILTAGNPLRGMQITVPPNSYSATKTFEISYAQIENHKLGSNFNPLSPLIKISNGGGYAENPINIKIPIKKTKDDFAIGFLYDASTGKLEALPLLDVNDSSVTVNTRHFSSTRSTLGKGLINDQSFTNLVVSSIKESVLLGQTVISSGFTPGVDDWEFINYGSFITEGHCAGQSMTAMWYFYEKKLNGAPQLFHRYDTINKSEDPSFVWYDNPLGYRFASTIQEDFNWQGWIRNVNIQSYLEPITWKTFIAAMLITGQPQLIIIKNRATNDGHAMIVYKIGVTEGILYIADPNYPNNRHTTGASSVRNIKYINGKFQPYDSFLKAGEPGITFDQFAFFGKTANIDWTKISKRFSELENKTIGNDRFPTYKLKYKLNTERIELKDTLTTSLELLDVSIEYSDAIKGTRSIVINENGEKYKDPLKINLELGKKKYGFYLEGRSPDKFVNSFINFRWITIERKAPPYSHAVISLDARDINKNFIVLKSGENITNVSFANKPPREPVKQSLVWTGNKFFVNYDYTYDIGIFGPYPIQHIGSITGELDSDAKKIKKLDANVKIISNFGSSTSTQSISFSDIPVVITNNQIISQTTDGDIKKYIISLEVNYFGEIINYVDWTNGKLAITFLK